MKITILFTTFLLLFFNRSYSQYQWTIKQTAQSSKDTLLSNEKYYLWNEISKKVLGYKSQKKGINLAWLSPQKTKQNIIFKDCDTDGVLTERDSVAICVEGGAYLRYGAREYGINIVWSQTPVYEWALMSQNEAITTSVQSPKKYALYNRTKQAYLIYAEKYDVGVLLQWSDEW
ncbi:MAG: hypothetical protein JNL70_06165 [Saprospiraceae bacterium]|nr:hypothetical protein [Saprospiraceae bacterium]